MEALNQTLSNATSRLAGEAMKDVIPVTRETLLRGDRAEGQSDRTIAEQVVNHTITRTDKVGLRLERGWHGLGEVIDENLSGEEAVERERSMAPGLLDVTHRTTPGRSPIYIFRSAFPGFVQLRCPLTPGSFWTEERTFATVDEAAGHLVSRGFVAIVLDAWSAGDEGDALERRVVDAMSIHGGSFVQALARAFMAADAENKRALRVVFRHYFADYERTWVRGGGGR